MKRLSDNDVDRIIDLYNQGWNKSKIARELNVSTTTVYRKLLENNITDYKKFSDAEKQAICDYYKISRSAAKTACYFNVEPSHIISVLNENNVKVLSNAEGHRRYSFNEDYFEKIDSPIKAYILGIIYADGCNCEVDHGIYIGLEEQDKYLLEDINAEIENTKPLMLIPRNELNSNWKNMYRIVIYSQKMQDDLLKHGVNFRKSWNLDYPYWLSYDLHSHFIRGYFDGDGSIFQTTFQNRTRYYADFVGTKQMCIGIKQILEKEDITCFIYESSAHNGITHSARVARYNDLYNLFFWMYKDKNLYLHRKYNRFIKYFNINNSLLA